MNELIPIRESQLDGPVRTVDARDLHRLLGVAKDFSDWIKAQFARARLVEGRHYCEIESRPLSGEHSRGGRNRRDYFITLEAAKHIAMMAGTDKGFEVRDYFIECERKAIAPARELTRMEILTMALESEKEVQRLQAENNVLATRVARTGPMAAALERIAAEVSDGNCITDAAKTLQIQPKQLFTWLEKNGWIFRRERGSTWVAYQARIDSGHLAVKISVVGTHDDGSPRTAAQVRITRKGLARLSMALGRDVRTAAATTTD